MKIKDYFYNIYELTKRNMLIFFKNKTTIFFSLIAPILIMVIYVLFLGDMQIKMISDSFTDLNISTDEIASIVNAWVMSGIIGISSLTVALNSMFITILDRERRIVDDFQASPVKIINLTLSYFISAFIITFLLSLAFAFIGTLYLFFSSNSLFVFTIVDVLKLIGILILSSLSAVITLMFITSFFKKTSTAASFTGVFTALIGFLIGAYMPASLLPPSVRNIANLIPGSHATALFRQIFLNQALKNPNLSNEFITSIKDQYGYNLEFFNYQFNTGTMIVYLLVTTILFFVIHLVVSRVKRKHKL